MDSQTLNLSSKRHASDPDPSMEMEEQAIKTSDATSDSKDSHKVGPEIQEGATNPDRKSKTSTIKKNR